MGRKRKKKASKLKVWLGIIAVLLLAVLGLDNRGVFTEVRNREQISQAISTIVNKDSNFKIFYFDVGQADCSLIMNNGKTMLIDAGNNEDGPLIVECLKELGIEKIDYLIGTHAHEDHIGGLDDVISAFSIGTIYMPKVQTNTQTFEDVLTIIESKNLTIKTPKIGESFSLDDCNCTIVCVDNETENLNLSSIVLRLLYGTQSFLFMGDAEIQNEESITWDKTNVVKIGHHGSDTSTSEEFLSQVQPEIAIISVGERNDYGHPKEEVLNRLQQKNVNILRTDTDGTIVLTCDGNTNTMQKLELCLDGN